MKRTFITIFLFLSIHAFGQISVEDYLFDFDIGVKLVENIYPGFDHKVTDKTISSYEFTKDSLRTAIKEGTSSFEDVFGRYLAWFRDYHLHDYCGAQNKYMPGPIDYSKVMEYKPTDTFCKVDDTSFLIRYTSCAWSKNRVRWIKKAIRAFKKSKCENLILDIRGNKGGSDGTSDAFIELLYNHDGYDDGEVVRNTTPINIDILREVMRHEKNWQKNLDACERLGEKYPTLFKPRVLHYNKISTLPLKAAIIIDNLTASCAEELILILKRVSDRVVIFGKDSTLGCLDYTNFVPFPLPKSNYQFKIPLTCTLGLPETGIDATGIVPDVMIDCEYPTSLTDNVDAWVLWVASWLKEH